MFSSQGVTINSVAVLGILDHFARRSSGAEDRVLGTLLGSVSSGGATAITASFPVPHHERETGIAIGKDVHKQFKALHLKSNPNEVVVGWYSLSSNPARSVDPWSVLIQDFYSSECNDPIHVVIKLDPKSISINAYRCFALGFDSEPLAAEFRPVPIVTVATDPERIGLAAMFRNDSHDSVMGSAEKLLSMLEKCSEYANDVAEGKITPDHEVGKKLSEVLASVPNISSRDFSAAFNQSLQDLLMVVHLTSLTRTQLQLSEKFASVM